MTTPVLTEDGKRLAEALVAHDVLVEHEGEYESHVLINAFDLNAAAASLRLPLEGDASLREAVHYAYRSGAVWASENPIHADMHAQRSLAADRYVAALARPQPEAKGPVAAGVFTRRVHGRTVLEVADLVEERLRDGKEPGANFPSGWLPFLVEGLRAALASTTPPAEAKTPDAGNKSARERTRELRDLVMSDVRKASGSNAFPGETVGISAGHLSVILAARLGCHFAAQTPEVLTPTGSAGEDDTGVREALTKAERALTQASWAVGRCCCGSVEKLNRESIDAVILQVRAVLDVAPQPPKAETPAGVPYGIIDPDYARVFTIARCIAWVEGYALMMHGSFTRDLDLIAVPWAETACEPEHLARRIEDAAGLKFTASGPGRKPHGRLAWTLLFPGFSDPRFVDLSVMPRALAAEAERDAAVADTKAAEAQNDALHVKLAALAPHGSCACSYDRPGDVCAHHSPALRAAEAEITRLRAGLERIAKPYRRVGLSLTGRSAMAVALATLSPKEHPHG